jgi:hypothetical protein
VIASSRRRRWFVRSAILPIALVLMGTLGHLAHHVLDPACDEGRASSPHPCACSVLHHAALTEGHVAIVPSTPAAPSELALRNITAPPVPIPGRCAPRGPPSA